MDECAFRANGSSFTSHFSFESCSTRIELSAEFIIYSNTVSYNDPFAAIQFFRDFTVSCKVKKMGSTSLLMIDTVTDRGLIGQIEDEFEFHEFADLIVVDRPEGASNEFRLGEHVTIGLDFDRLDANFDYRMNRCWAMSPTNDGNLLVSLFLLFLLFSGFLLFVIHRRCNVS